MIKFEKEVIQYLGLPNIPRKEFDGETPFDKGVAVVELFGGEEAYAACSFNPDKGNTKPTITKVFGIEPFRNIKRIYVVPNYMSTLSEVDEMDLDDVSKMKATELLQEADELENEGVLTDNDVLAPDNEYYFNHIHNDEEAKAFIISYNRKNRIKGRIPKSHEGLVMRLAVIYSDTNKNNK